MAISRIKIKILLIKLYIYYYYYQKMQLRRIVNLQHIIDIKDEAWEDIFALTNNTNTNKIIRDLFVNSIKKEERQTISPRDRGYLYKLLQPQTSFFDKLDRSPDVQQAYLIIKNILCVNKTDHQIYICNHVKNSILWILETEQEKIMLSQFESNNEEVETFEWEYEYMPEDNFIPTTNFVKRTPETSKIIPKTPTTVEIPSEDDILEAMTLHNWSTYTRPEEDKDLWLSDDELADLLSRMKTKNANLKKEKTQA